jgi:hypothetical protein
MHFVGLVKRQVSLPPGAYLCSEAKHNVNMHKNTYKDIHMYMFVSVCICIYPFNAFICMYPFNAFICMYVSVCICMYVPKWVNVDAS